MRIDDTRPIWVQLVETYRRRIASGAWAPAAKIPSVRELALEAQANPNTIQRALGELDREGLTAAERAQGRFVTTDPVAIALVRRELALRATDEHIHSLRSIGMELPEAQDLLSARWDRDATTPEGGEK
ncbi:GntR family transcriptional regulator [Schaalia sp. 19OD2882]|uniref:GntR family transcriptional regulator n=1 Tax=Schaalia sp. 19OD2882 TaxID=2794089 RepID=UPI001C1EBDA6|nr:GntR family transcriptional regulator [Schaalia sp. 19OD2882]QWW20080.1 GntR family transcriptional regulator [Schaalia sp. 19OD2882]